MLEFLGTVLEALAGRGGSAGIVQAMLERAAAMEASPDPAARKAGQELRARANAVLKSMAPPQQLGSPSAPVSVSPSAQAARAVAPPPRPRASVRPVPSATVRPVAPAARPVPAASTGTPPAQPHAVNPLLADLQGRSSLLRAIVTLEALGAPIALRDELGGPLAHR